MFIFARNCGTVKSCRTSIERSSTLTGLPMGRCSFLACDQDVVLTVRIVRIDAERVRRR